MNTPLSQSDLGIYVHIPFCLRKCRYCAFYSEPIALHDPKTVVEAIIRELDLYRASEPIQTLYIGGGLPTCLPTELLCDLIRAITARTGVPKECTVECNPAQADIKMFELLLNCGVNRLSIGAQSFTPAELETLGRPHSPKAIEKSVTEAYTAGFENIGLDLIFGIPGSTLQTFALSLSKAFSLAPAHISAYSLTWEDGTPLTRALTEGHIAAINEEEEREMYHLLCKTMTEAGYMQYEISNFARPGCQCRHNLRYWNNRPVLGLGPGASSWYRGRRTANIADIGGYVKIIQQGRLAWDTAEIPGPVQIASETAILGLRTTEGLDPILFQAETGYDMQRLFAQAIDEHCSSGLLEQSNGRLRLTKKGRSFADTVACDFVLP